MKNDKTTGTKPATIQLADINAQIEALKQQRIGLSEPLKAKHTELTGELLELEIQVKELTRTWKPASLRPKIDDKIREILAAGPIRAPSSRRRACAIRHRRAAAIHRAAFGVAGFQ